MDLNEKNRADARAIYKKGHEFGNHMPEDKAYDDLDELEFSSQLEETERCLQTLMQELKVEEEEKERGNFQEEDFRPAAVQVASTKWFRPPLAKISSSMLSVLQRGGYKVALADVFANDVLFQDCEYLCHVVRKHVKAGSILCLHMPDEEFREKNVEETRLVLQVLKEKGLKATTLTELYNKSSA